MEYDLGKRLDILEEKMDLLLIKAYPEQAKKVDEKIKKEVE